MRTYLIAAACGSALLLSACRTEQANVKTAKTEAPPIPAAAIKLAAENLPYSVSVTGSLVSSTQVDIKAETVGRVTRFDKEEGDAVSAGEEVVRVNDESYQLALRQAESALKVADAGLERARLLESHSSAELERSENLVKSGGITDKDLKAARIAQQDAQAQVAVAVAQRDQAQTAIDVARKHLRDAVIHSPVSGTIQKKFVNKGAYVEAPTLLFTVVDNSNLELQAAVPSAELAAIRPGLPVSFTVNAYPGQKFEGQVIEVAPAVDADTRSAKTRIRAPNAAGKLKAGMFAQGEILTGSNPRAIVVPQSAVYRDDRSAKASYVFVVQDGKAVKRSVRIGHEKDGRLEIVEGLQPGDLVISEQSIEIAEGVRVEPRS